MKFKLRSIFSGKILERGKRYFQEGRVSNILQVDFVITAKILGRNNYSASINLETDEFTCNCPYDGIMCKHLAALCYELNKRKNIKKISSKTLQEKSKEEIISLVKEILLKEPSLNFLLLSKEDQIIKQIEKLDIVDEEEWYEFYDYIPNRVENILIEIEKVKNPLKFLLVLLEKVQELNIKYDYHGSTEDSVSIVLEEIIQLQKGLSEKGKRKMDTKIKTILGENYQSFVNEIKNV